MRMRWRVQRKNEKPPPTSPREQQNPVPGLPTLPRAAGNRAIGAALNRSVSDVAGDSDKRLPDAARLGAMLGADLSEVKVTLGGPAAAAALAGVRAHAATVGDQIVFDSPDPSAAVVAHEAAHVVQQRIGTGGTRAAAEAEAHRVSAAVGSGRAMPVGQAAPPGPLLLKWEPGLTAPPIKHDHGFLDDGSGSLDLSKMEAPTAGDYVSLAKWRAMLYGAQALRSDLGDATRAYEHFLDGGGADLTVQYERFIADDPNGAVVLASALEDLRDGARQQDNDWLAAHPSSPVPDHSFDIRSDPIGVGADARYPYPKTENWQKAIGAHMLWISAHVDVTVDNAAGTRTMKMKATLHMEDRYNFNPGAADIATGTKDAENGRFEITGLGHEFMQYGTCDRTLELTEALGALPGGSGSGTVSGAPRSTPREYRHDREGAVD